MQKFSKAHLNESMFENYNYKVTLNVLFHITYLILLSTELLID